MENNLFFEIATFNITPADPSHHRHRNQVISFRPFVGLSLAESIITEEGEEEGGGGGEGEDREGVG